MCLHYLVKLIARVLSPYIKTRLVLWQKVTFPLVLILTPSTMRHEESCRREITTRGRLQMLKTSPAHRGRVGTSWSAHYRRRSEGMAKTTASVCCCWRRTVWTWTVTPGATLLLQLCIMTLTFNCLTAYNICRDCLQCSSTLSVTCSRCEAL